MIRAIAAAAVLLAAPASASISKNGRIDYADAQKITDTCLAMAAAKGWKVHVAVLNEYGDMIRLVGMDGASRTSASIAPAKGRTVFRTGRPSRDAAKSDPSIQRLFDAMALPGGIPVLLNGKLVGAAAASGASSDDDEACVTAGVQAAM